MILKQAIPKVSIIILNFNGLDVTRDCLDSIANVKYPAVSTILIDNGSTDGSYDFFSKHYATITTVRNDMNLGFTGGNNQGIAIGQRQGADYLLFLNNDTLVEPSFLNRLVEAAESDHSIGAVVPKILFHPSDSIIWYGGGNRSFFRGAHMRGFLKKDGPAYTIPRKVTYATGCALLVRMELLRKIGGFNERLFLYCEDLELSIRIQKAGYTIQYIPQAIVRHRQPLRNDPSQNARKRYYFIRNILLVHYWHYNFFLFTLFLMYFLTLWAPSRICIHLMRKDTQSALAVIRGFMDFIPAATTQSRKG